MTGLKRCETCRGTKKKLGMGGMQKDCSDCKGIGWIEPPIQKEITDAKNLAGEIIPVVKKKMGRPKRLAE